MLTSPTLATRRPSDVFPIPSQSVSNVFKNASTKRHNTLVTLFIVADMPVT